MNATRSTREARRLFPLFEKLPTRSAWPADRVCSEHVDCVYSPEHRVVWQT
jgi:hypothetical protein